MARRAARSATLELQNIKAGIGIGHVHHARCIDETIARLNHLRSVWPRIEHALRIGRHEIAGFAWRKWIFDVVSAHAGIVQSRKNVLRTLESARAIFP